jgi:hypothetical protein
LSTSFELVAITDGRTEILEHTSYALRLDPIFYWLPFARWIVHENNGRVLTHIRINRNEPSERIGVSGRSTDTTPGERPQSKANRNAEDALEGDASNVRMANADLHCQMNNSGGTMDRRPLSGLPT